MQHAKLRQRTLAVLVLSSRFSECGLWFCFCVVGHKWDHHGHVMGRDARTRTLYPPVLDDVENTIPTMAFSSIWPVTAAASLANESVGVALEVGEPGLYLDPREIAELHVGHQCPSRIRFNSAAQQARHCVAGSRDQTRKRRPGTSVCQCAGKLA